MKRFMTAALAVFFMLSLFTLTAYAAELDATEELTEEMIIIIAEESPAIDDIPEDTEDITDISETPSTEEEPEAAELPALPPGTGTIIDFNTDPDGRLFYTIMTPDEQVFYLVIDKNRSADNVYFLNAVTVSDLAALAEIPLPTQNSTATTPPTGESEQPTEKPPTAERKQSGGNMGMYIIIGILVIAGGGAGWYFKIYRPKQQSSASVDEYDPSMDEQENDYTADWGDDTDENEAYDPPPWSGDEENSDGESEDDE